MYALLERSRLASVPTPRHPFALEIWLQTGCQKTKNISQHCVTTLKHVHFGNQTWMSETMVFFCSGHVCVFYFWPAQAVAMLEGSSRCFEKIER